MRLMELYENIDNPISSPEVIKKLIELYATCNGNFYSRLTKSTIKAHTRGEHYKADADIFYSMLFNKHINFIIPRNSASCKPALKFFLFVKPSSNNTKFTFSFLHIFIIS